MATTLPKKLIDTLLRIQGTMENLLVLLSGLAIGLIVANEFVLALMPPAASSRWFELYLWIRTFIWLAFVVNLVTYGILSSNVLRYARAHIPEILICFCWVPHGGQGLLRFLSHISYPSDMLSVEITQLLGVLAHGYRVVRWTVQRFAAHPLIVTGSAAVLLIAASSALLTHFEPATFPGFWTAVWFCLTTVTTVGYGDVVPKTIIGRLITSGLILSGVSLAGVFIGLMSEYVRQRLSLKNITVGGVSLVDMKHQIDAGAEIQKQILQTLKENNDLSRQLLDVVRNAGGAQAFVSASPPVDTENLPAQLLTAVKTDPEFRRQLLEALSEPDKPAGADETT